MNLVTCSGCVHASPSPHHGAIMHCLVGVQSGAATGGWFATDTHPCDEREEVPGPVTPALCPTGGNFGHLGGL